MTVGLTARGVRLVLLDIEGTTTPMSFVTETLFPFARAQLRDFLIGQFRVPEVQAAMRLLQAEWTADRTRGENPPSLEESPPRARLESFAVYLEWQMDRDRKSPGLKQVQGLIWKRGYEGGMLRGEVYADVLPAFERWKEAAVGIAIYSSGSVLAQRLLFGSTASGDLTPFIQSFFDTGVGAKTAPDSYARIASSVGCATGDLLFVSDMVPELTAASTAGVQALLCVRPGNPAQPASPFATIESFEQIVA